MSSSGPSGTGAGEGLFSRRRVGTFAVCLVAMVTAWMAAGAVGGAEGEDSLSTSEFLALLESGHWMGPRTAPVIVLVYHDYLCGYSIELDGTLNKLRARYLRTCSRGYQALC